MHTLQAKGANQNVVDNPRGGIHVWPLPVGVPSGSFQFSAYPTLTPPGMQVEISLSKCPGDVGYWKTPTAINHDFGGTFYVCGGSGSGEATSVAWGPSSTFYQCAIPLGEQWYLNWRVLNNSCSDRTCGQTFYWY